MSIRQRIAGVLRAIARFVEGDTQMVDSAELVVLTRRMYDPNVQVEPGDPRPIILEVEAISNDFQGVDYSELSVNTTGEVGEFVIISTSSFNTEQISALSRALVFPKLDPKDSSTAFLATSTEANGIEIGTFNTALTQAQVDEFVAFFGYHNPDVRDALAPRVRAWMTRQQLINELVTAMQVENPLRRASTTTSAPSTPNPLN